MNTKLYKIVLYLKIYDKLKYMSTILKKQKEIYEITIF